jgi:photosystem II stability/assembly factor-like uncharacterized protein
MSLLRRVREREVRCWASVVVGVALWLGAVAPALASDQAIWGAAGLQYRLIGPFRGGRVLAVSGVPGQPETFYLGAVGGGLWRTTDGGRVWQPLFDGPPSGSIGAFAVAASDPQVLYVGTGEADMRSDISLGDGMYRSRDGGATWRHVGLTDSRQIGRILVDPHHPEIVLVAVLGHGFGPNSERGVYRSTDGGETWKRVLGQGDDTGAIDLALDPVNPQIVYASAWNVRRVFWSTYAPLNGPGAGIYKSTDGGVSWAELKGHGLPSKLGRIGLATTAGGGHTRVYALVDGDPAGLYRSDDQGGSWTLVSKDGRLTSRPWYFGGITADPRDPDVVYVSNVSIYRSRDGGAHFAAIKGAPGGDDYHSLWIDPDHPERMILGCDQGAAISVDGAATWSSWYNQPTAQMYHVSVDDSFPYTVYGAQQDSGTAAVPSRGDLGQINEADIYSVGAGESGNIFVDPNDKDAVLGGSTGGRLYRFWRSTHQLQDISPTMGPRDDAEHWRYPWTAALSIAPQAPHAIYQGSQFVHRSRDGGASWTIISPDLTVRPEARPNDDAAHRGVIWTLTTSPQAEGLVWIGTDTGVIQMTRDDGAHWRSVTPSGLPPWSMVSTIEASPHNAATAYAAIDRHQVDDIAPYVYRTHDNGASWTPITKGLAGYVHVVREDPVRKGLLFAGTEYGVFVSYNDGDDWQPLQLNLPHASVRDLVIHGADLVVATHGRSFWILDDIEPLRELGGMTTARDLRLLKPETAVRIRQSENQDTPFPLETPVGINPPPGAVIDYRLPTGVSGEVTLEIVDAQGHRVRRYSNHDGVPALEDTESFPLSWLHPPVPLAGTEGLHRFVWDLRHTAPPALTVSTTSQVARSQEIEQVPLGPLVLPGVYTVRLTAGGSHVDQTITIVNDPRLRVSIEALEKQQRLEFEIRDTMAVTVDAIKEVRAALGRLGEGKGSKERSTLRDELEALVSEAGDFGAPPAPGGESHPSLVVLNGGLANLAVSVDSADAAPTAPAVDALGEYRHVVEVQVAAWKQLRAKLPQVSADQ